MGRSNLVPHESEWRVSICLIRSINSTIRELLQEHDGRTASDQDSATEEREMSDSLMETVLVQIACARKDILLHISSG
jgi:hypothetical protein